MLVPVLLCLGEARAGVCACNADIDNNGLFQVQDWACIQDCKGGDCSCCVNSCDINCDGVVDDLDAGTDIFTEISAFRCQFIGFPAASCCGSCCNEPTGACNDDLWQSHCDNLGRTWNPGLSCAEISCDPPVVGACCDLDFGTCQNGVQQSACAGANVLWTQGQSCSPVTCPPPPTGACCVLSTGQCFEDIPQAGCTGAGMSWADGQPCTQATCPSPPTGACCNTGNGLCEDDVLAVDCSGPQHVWTESSACSSVSCGVSPQDPCTCNADVDNNGLFQVQDWACIQDCKGGDCSCCVNSCDINCDGVVDDADAGTDIFTEVSAFRCRFIGIQATSCCGACCVQEGGLCNDVQWQSHCSDNGGIWSSGVNCGEINCNALPTGACCDLDAQTCTNDTIEADCTGANATWSEGQSCSPALCPLPPTGACCHSTLGTCDNGVTEANCTGASDVWTEAQSCSPENCPMPEPGACCNLASGICMNDVLPGNCADASHVWTTGQTCSQVNCSVPPQDPCLCDGEVNGASPLNVLDIVAIADCAQNNCGDCVGSCDINCSGLVDYIDMGAAACQFRGKFDCCAEPWGACYGAQGLPACVVTTFDGCDLLQGTYQGNNTICTGTQQGTTIPAASTWSLTILALFMATAATVMVLGRRRAIE